MLLEIKGNRVLQRTSTGGSITDILTFDGYTETSISGGSTSTIKYYGANGQRVALKLNGTLSYLLSDTLGSSTIALNSDGSGQALQLYSPYGSVRYSWGSMPTSYNFTGQRLDSQTGLLYYNFRYYDPVSERFVRADTVQSNAGGMDPYAYVGDNPETKGDPTGHIVLGEDGSFGHIDLSGYLTSETNAYAGWLWDYNTPTEVYKPIYNPNTDTANSPFAKLSRATGWSQFQQTWNDPHASWLDKATAFGNMVTKNVNNLLILSMLLSGPEGDAAEIGGSAVETALGDLGGVCGGGLSFSAATHVATAHGEQPIGTLHIGDKVWAYNPRTHTMELQPILHVWINHDSDLVDLIVTTPTKTQHGKPASSHSEVIHTNQRHPFLTLEAGFVPVSQLTIGMHLRRADGSLGIVTGKRLVPGVQTMYNLEVALDHTFTVGEGQWVVHNCDISQLVNQTAGRSAQRMINAFTDHLTPSDLEGAWRDLHNDPVPNPFKGGFYNHYEEVKQALDSGKNAIEVFKNLLDGGTLSEEDQCIVQCLLSRTSLTMDYVEKVITRDIWVPGTQVPFP